MAYFSCFRLVFMVMVCAAVMSCRATPEPVARTAPPGATAEIRHVLAAMVAEHRLDGAAIIIRKDNKTLLEHTVGNYTLDSRVPVASATKWITAATVMTNVDNGTLDLDQSIDAYISGVPADKAKLTVRQLLSHTSGLPGQHALRMQTRQDMQNAIQKLLQEDLIAPPGTEVIYGGVSFQVAGFVAATVAQTQWQDLYRARIAAPLDWQAAVWNHPMRPAGRRAVKNPNLGAGLHISANEYITFLEMLSNNGKVGQRTVLSANAVQTLFTDNTKSLGRAHLPKTANPSWGYGLGCWCQKLTVDGDCRLVNSAGAFGTFPWFDRDTGVYGVIVVKTRLPDILEELLHIQQQANNL